MALPHGAVGWSAVHGIMVYPGPIHFLCELSPIQESIRVKKYVTRTIIIRAGPDESEHPIWQKYCTSLK